PATQLPVELSTLLLLALVMIVASIALRRSQGDARLLGRRQAALGALATSVAAEQPLEETLAMASEQLIGLLEADSAGIVRFEDVAEVASLAGSADRSRQQLTAQALTDPLTGLANRRWLQERLEQETSRALRHGRRMAVALLDVDAFKGVNDAAGHESGDRA